MTISLNPSLRSRAREFIHLLVVGSPSENEGDDAVSGRGVNPHRLAIVYAFHFSNGDTFILHVDSFYPERTLFIRRKQMVINSLCLVENVEHLKEPEGVEPKCGKRKGNCGGNPALPHQSNLYIAEWWEARSKMNQVP